MSPLIQGSATALPVIDTDWPIFTYFIWQNSNVIFDALVHAVK